MSIDIVGIVAIVILLIANIIGWFFTYGRLTQRVQSIEHILDNGLSDKLDKASTDIAKLEGIIEVYREQKQQ